MYDHGVVGNAPFGRTRVDIRDGHHEVVRHLVPHRTHAIDHLFGIDNSTLMARVAKLLNGDATTVLDDALALPQVVDSMLLSRFVASYVFPDASALLAWSTLHFDAIAIEDPFTTDGSNWSGQNHGQPEAFFALPELVDGLLAAGYAVGLIAAYGDWPAGTRSCHVVKLVAFREESEWDSVNQAFQRLTGSHLTPVQSGCALLDDLNSSVTEADWNRIRAAKEASPVWGPTASDYGAPNGREEKRAERALGPWRDYGLAGPAAVAAIARALDERHVNT